MTTIVSSRIAADDRQIDGRRWIHEIHEDDAGHIYERWYLCDADFEAATALAFYVVQLDEMLAAAVEEPLVEETV